MLRNRKVRAEPNLSLFSWAWGFGDVGVDTDLYVAGPHSAGGGQDLRRTAQNRG